MNRPELLAPAGSYEALVAAINAGCDAVYLSGYMFGARKFAPNFSREELIEAIITCHIYGVKVYVTVNTLIYEEEVNDFLEYIDFLHKNNVDAVIMQDLGMIDLIRQTYPNLEIHASTQMNIHNLEGVKLCDDIGIKRVVLARETENNTIKRIKENTNIELEVFVHGALCISYSGQCLMSSLIGGRSGNRGACAGTCRLAYKIFDDNNNKLNKNDYVLSTKDLNVLEHIGELIDLGVDSFKIEGRMKRPEYVFLVVSLYRKAIDSYLTTGKVSILDSDIKELKKVFNREFTKGFMFGETNDNIINDFRPNHLGVSVGKVVAVKNNLVTIKVTDKLALRDGIRFVESDSGCTITNMITNNKRILSATDGDVITIKIDDKIKLGDIVVKTTDFHQLENLKPNIKSINKKIDIWGNIILRVGDKIHLELSDGINTVKVDHSVVEAANKAPLTDDSIFKQINKLGSTPFNLKELNIVKDNSVFINNRELNEVRRLAVDKLIDARNYKIEYKRDNYNSSVPELNAKNEVNILLEDPKLYDSIKDYKVDHIYVENIDMVSANSDDRLVLKLPRIVNTSKIFSRPLLISEIGSLSQPNILGTDFSFNVTNSYAVAFLHNLGVKKVTLSYELDYDHIKMIVDKYVERYKKNPNLEVIVYGREEMMVSKFSLNKKYNKNELKLVDRYNKYYPVRSKNGSMYIYNSTPRDDKNVIKYFKIGIASIRYNIFSEDDLLKIDLKKD